MRTYFLPLWIFFLFGCASHRTIHSREPVTALFPYGTYTHEVTLSLKSGKQYHFSGIVSLRAKEIRVIGLGLFGATAFRIIENRSNGERQVAIYQEALKAHENELRNFFDLMRTVLLLPTKDANAQVLTTKQGEVVFEDYDKNQIPQKIIVRRPEFTVTIVVSGYDL